MPPSLCSCGTQASAAATRSAAAAATALVAARWLSLALSSTSQSPWSNWHAAVLHALSHVPSLSHESGHPDAQSVCSDWQHDERVLQNAVWPLGHEVQYVAPDVLYFPLSHELQLDEPDELEYLPASQYSQPS